MVIHSCKPSTWEAEARGWLVQGQPGIKCDPVSKKKNKKKKKKYRKRKVWTHTHRECHEDTEATQMMTEAETGVKLLPAKKHWSRQKLKRGKIGSSTKEG
jgi:hypothetical protein